MPKIISVRSVLCPGVDTPHGFIPKGLNKSGYGKKISTSYEVLYEDSNRWYKVYIRCFSNVGMCYTSRGFQGVEEAIRDYRIEQNSNRNFQDR